MKSMKSWLIVVLFPLALWAAEFRADYIVPPYSGDSIARTDWRSAAMGRGKLADIIIFTNTGVRLGTVYVQGRFEWYFHPDTVGVVFVDTLVFRDGVAIFTPTPCMPAMFRLIFDRPYKLGFRDLHMMMIRKEEE